MVILTPFPPTLLLATLLPFSCWAHAQADANGPAGEVVVTANRIPVPLRRVPASISILDAEAIEAHGNLPLTDVLRQLPSVSATGNGGVGKITTLNIRGEEGYRTLAIFDGIRLSDPSGVQVAPQLEHLMSGGIGRVEFLRGPQGLGYGADAGGVLNLSSRRAEEGTSLDLDLQAGAFGTRRLGADLAGARGSLDYFLSLGDFETEGFNARPSDTSPGDRDGYANRTVHGRLGWRVSDAWRVDLVHRAVDGDTAFDGCFAIALAHDCASDYRFGATRVALEHAGETSTHALSYADSETERDIFALGEPAFSARGRLQRLEYLGSATGLRGVDLVFGADSEEMRGDGSERRNHGFHVEALSDFSSRLFLSAGARHDDNDDFGRHTTWRLGAAWLQALGGDAELKYRAAWGTGLRAPSPYEIAYNAGPFAAPPASSGALSEERSRGYEAGLDYDRAGGTRLSATWFNQAVEDAIVFDLAGFSGYLQERGRAESRGLELSGSLPLAGGMQAQMNYTWNQTRRPDGRPRARRPRHLANVGVSWGGADGRLSLDAFYRASRGSLDEDAAGLVALDDFGVLDLGARYRFTSGLELHGRLENALDEDYQEIRDYATAGRAFYLGLRLRFGTP